MGFESPRQCDGQGRWDKSLIEVPRKEIRKWVCMISQRRSSRHNLSMIVPSTVRPSLGQMGNIPRVGSLSCEQKLTGVYSPSLEKGIVSS